MMTERPTSAPHNVQDLSDVIVKRRRQFSELTYMEKFWIWVGVLFMIWLALFIAYESGEMIGFQHGYEYGRSGVYNPGPHSPAFFF